MHKQTIIPANKRKLQMKTCLNEQNKSEDARAAELLYSEMLGARLQPDVSSYNSLISAASRCGDYICIYKYIIYYNNI